MFLHISNLVHFALFITLFVCVEIYLRQTSASRFRTTLRLLQVLPVIFIVDVLAGVFVVEALYGAQLSAAWIAKTVWMYPGLFLIAGWRVLRRKKASTNKAQLP